MTTDDFRRIALSLAGVAEGSHFGNADFRVGGTIFATLSLEKQGYGVLLLTPEQQAGMVEDLPAVFSPVPGGWGQQGSTRVQLSNVKADMLESALRTAWLRRAPVKATAKPAKPARNIAAKRAATKPGAAKPSAAKPTAAKSKKAAAKQTPSGKSGAKKTR
jgi:hypothetical protein